MIYSSSQHKLHNILIMVYFMTYICISNMVSMMTTSGKACKLHICAVTGVYISSFSSSFTKRLFQMQLYSINHGRSTTCKCFAIKGSHLHSSTEVLHKLLHIQVLSVLSSHPILLLIDLSIS